ncbi:MAG: phosphodiesterase [Clostridia bacterium]|nr:phosphodiesterase [Clostridia bacterium]
MKEKLIIASDIHGSAFWCQKLIELFEREGAKNLLLLGDLLYHGPRNPLPDGYAPMEVAKMLSAIKEKLICVRGNCDSEVDQMVLDFPMLADSGVVLWNGKRIHATHGHLWSADNTPPLSSGDLFVNGHFHEPALKILESGATYANCGSVALPKANTPHSCIIFDGESLIWKDLQTGEPFEV